MRGSNPGGGLFPAALSVGAVIALAGATVAWVTIAFGAVDAATARSGAAAMDPGIPAGTIQTVLGAAPVMAHEGALQTPAVAAQGSNGGARVSVTFTIRPQDPPQAIIPIYRFYSSRSGTHFYTPSPEERDMVIARWPDVWGYEGIAYTVNPARNFQPLYRFYNNLNGSHFYTASIQEANHVIANWSGVFSYDGETYGVTPYPESGKTAVYRFLNSRNGSHFYTASLEEANHVIATWPDIYTLEGPAFWLGQ